MTLAFLAVIMMACISSCGNSDILSSSAAKKALKKEAVFAKNHCTVTFGTGFYEVDSDELDKLARLQDAGMITFSVESATETVTEYKYSWYSGRSEYTYEREHDFAQVDLTEAGRKLAVENPVLYSEDTAGLKRKMDEYSEDIPEYMNTIYVRPQLPENRSDVTDSDSIGTAMEVVETVETSTEVEEIQTGPDVNAKYNALLARVHKTDNNMLSGRFTLEEVMDVFCPEELAKEGKGSCRFIAKFVDKTAFGYVLGAPGNLQLREGKATFRRYVDKGWTVESID